MKQLGVLLLALLAAAQLGCTDTRPNLLLISIDSLRADRLHYDGAEEALAPRMESFASESLVYRHAVSAAPWTTPSMVSVMTGLPVPAHGVDDHDRALSTEIPTLAESFSRAGYRTAAFVPAVTLRPEFGFGRGFEIYDYEEFGHTRLSSPALIGKVLHQLDAWRDDGPWLIWVHLWDPHYNYFPPAPFDSRHLRGEEPPSEEVQCLKWYENPVTVAQAEYFSGQFDGEIAFTDKQLGELLDELESRALDTKTIVALTADHGEAFLEHGWLGHTNRVDETLIHVPLMIRYPGALSAGQVEAPVSLTGVARTLLELAGVPAGSSYSPALPLSAADTADARAGALSETRRRGCYTTLLDREFKYVLEHTSCQEQLFRLADDPGEETDLSAERSDALSRLRREMRRRLQAIEAKGYARAMLPAEIRAEAEQRLRSVGYVGGGAGAGEADPENPCAGAFSGGVDSFGDRKTEIRCPQRGALDCLERKGVD